MSSYELSEEARRDYFEAFDFIAGYSERGALKWQARMIEAFDHLAEWPRSGMLRPEYGSETIRFWIEGDYVVLYDPSFNPLRIIAILHGAQDLGRLLARRIEDYEEE